MLTSTDVHVKRIILILKRLKRKPEKRRELGVYSSAPRAMSPIRTIVFMYLHKTLEDWWWRAEESGLVLEEILYVFRRV